MGRLSIRRLNQRKTYSYFSGHKERNYWSWLLPFFLAMAVTTGGHLTLVQAEAPTATELQQHLQDNELEVGYETVGQFTQIYYMYDGEKIFITDENANFTNPEADGEFVTWVRPINGRGQIFRHNIITGQTLQLTNYSTNLNPTIENGAVAWEHWTGNDWQIQYFDGNSVSQLTSGTVSVRPKIFNGRVVYATKHNSGKWRVYLYDPDNDSSQIIANNVSEELAWPHIENGEIKFNFPSSKLAEIF